MTASAGCQRNDTTRDETRRRRNWPGLARPGLAQPAAADKKRAHHIRSPFGKTGGGGKGNGDDIWILHISGVHRYVHIYTHKSSNGGCPHGAVRRQIVAYRAPPSCPVRFALHFLRPCLIVRAPSRVVDTQLPTLSFLPPSSSNLTVTNSGAASGWMESQHPTCVLASRHLDGGENDRLLGAR